MIKNYVTDVWIFTLSNKRPQPRLSSSCFNIILKYWYVFCNILCARTYFDKVQWFVYKTQNKTRLNIQPLLSLKIFSYFIVKYRLIILSSLINDTANLILSNNNRVILYIIINFYYIIVNLLILLLNRKN
jgi:hypothetical protein